MIQLLSSSAFIICNKKLAKKLGLKATILLSDLISKQEYFMNHDLIDPQGYFFNTQENIEKDTTLTPYQQRNALRTLKKEMIIETKKMGIPAKLHYRINEEQVVKLLDNRNESNFDHINKNKKITTNLITIQDRLERFCKIVFSLNYNNSTCKDFISYWTEKNKSGKKMKFEMEKTFDINRRMKRWESNEKKWEQKNPKTFSKIDAQLSQYEQAKKML